MTGISAQIVAHLTANPDGLTSRELIALIMGEEGDKNNVVHSSLWRMRINGTLEYSRGDLGSRSKFFLAATPGYHPLELAMEQWDVTESEKLREEYAQTSAT
jgi:hypothetical protein